MTLQKCNPCDLKIHRVADLIRPFSVTAKYCRSVIQRMIILLFTYGFDKSVKYYDDDYAGDDDEYETCVIGCHIRNHSEISIR